MDEHLSASGADMSESEHLDRLMYRFECAEVLMQAGVRVGLLKVARDGPEWKVIQIQLVPELQGQGLGAELLHQIIREANAAKATLGLSVLKANPARSLYERLGFVIESESGPEYNMRWHPRP
jgi:ribosomal protein S18 acetylase RimI-like enzyme